jgi:hypothetical protein
LSWAGITAKPGWARSAAPRLGQVGSGPDSRRAGWTGRPLPRLGRLAPGRPASRSSSFPRLGRDSAPRPGRLFSRPASPDPPRLGLPAGWARWQGSPGWAGTCSPGWAASSAPAGGPALHRAPAGPDQEDPAWPGIISRPPSCNPGWAGLGYSGWARSVLPWPPDYYLGGRITPLQGRYLPPPAYLLVRHRLQPLVPVLGRL